jgi:hypothetical protein
MHSQIRDNRYEPGDEIAGAWTVERLLRMNERFVERLERAFARGLENRPQETTNEAHRRQEHAAQMNGESPICTRCGDAFVPIRGGDQQKYCSPRCRELAYLERCALAKRP